MNRKVLQSIIIIGIISIITIILTNTSNAASLSVSASKSSVSPGETFTVTVTLSNGLKPADPTPTPTPTPSCRSDYFFIQQGNTGVQIFNATKAAYPDFKIYVNYVDQCSNGDAVSGVVCNSSTYDAKYLSSCDNIYLTIVK